MYEFWSMLDGAERRDLCGAGHIRVFPDSCELYVQGHRTGVIMVLLDAHVRVTRRTGNGEVWLAFRGPGDVIGEMSLVDDRPHSATVAAVGGGRALVLSHEAFDAVARRHDGLHRALLRVVSQRLRCADDERSVGDESVLLRVARLLDQTRRDAGPAGVVPVRFQHEMAELLGVSRASVVRALSKLRAGGIVSTRHGRVTVLDPVRLGRLLPGERQSA